MKEIRMDLVQLLMVNGSNDRVRALEVEAEMNYIFAKDNGKDIIRRKDESLGEYIERYSVKTMRNFSRKKYEKLKDLCNEYNTYGDSKIKEESFIIAEDAKNQNGFERLKVMVQTFIGDLFKNSKKKFV